MMYPWMGSSKNFWLNFLYINVFFLVPNKQQIHLLILYSYFCYLQILDVKATPWARKKITLSLFLTTSVNKIIYLSPHNVAHFL